MYCVCVCVCDKECVIKRESVFPVAVVTALREESKHVIGTSRAVVKVTCLPTSLDVTSCAEAGSRENTSN